MNSAISPSDESLSEPLEIPRVAVLGCGSIGRRHLSNLYALGARDLVVFDANPQIAEEETQKYFGVMACSQIEDVWATTPWSVLVASPSEFHLQMARRALESGSHVFVEKPLSTSTAGLEELAALAKSSKRTSMVACNMRFHPGPAMVRRLLQDGAIGSLLSYRVHTGSYLPHWRPAQDYRKSYSASIEHGGAILDCIHELDLALWYAGPGKLLAAKSVPARSIDLQTEGLAEILIEHDSGALGSVHLNFMERDYRRSCVCIGSEGTIEWNFSESAVLEYRPEPGKIVRHPLAEDWQINTMYVDEIRYFLTCALQNKPTFNSIQDNLGCLKLALEAKSRA